MNISSLDAWTGHRLEADVRRSNLDRSVLAGLRRTVRYARKRSPWYRNLLSGLPLPESTTDLSAYPLTSPEDLCRDPMRFLCVPQDDIDRVVTLQTSGTSGPPKRLFFTAADLELTVDFFHHGMATLTEPGWPVLILMPGPKPASIGNLLLKGLRRLGALPVLCPPTAPSGEILEQVEKRGIRTMVSPPVVMQKLLQTADANRLKRSSVETVLVSSDATSPELRTAMEAGLECRVFDHWGMTETGYGGAVECDAHAGCHIRELDLYLEIIDPVTTEPLPHGHRGEIVVTTLTRTGQVLIRYRTGDISRILPGRCPCGSVIRRLDTITGRTDTDKPKAMRTE